ncbi:MAG: type III pantothenate kinase [Alphaproteobacteria bacterium]|nr:type III pantothenate kinase [Alphaproteobacteria bacterium]MBV9693866.1 type III pantothenate kinase [Alphaproteobacteria bacterium]
MLLAIDAGNTNIVFAIHDGKEIRAQWRAMTRTVRTADEYAVWLSALLALKGMSFADLSDAAIATVVPAALFDLRALCRTYLDCEPLIVDSSLDLGIGINADRPAAVGVDRLCNTVAAHERYKGAVIVVDFGTTTNFDIVAENGDFDGSVLAPGAALSVEALHQAAAMLPRVAIHRAQKVIGRDTIPAMQSGIYWGYVGLIGGLIDRIKHEYARPMTVVATGGLAHLFQPDIPAIDHVDPDLTIRGLVHIFHRNAGGLGKHPG